MSKRMCHGTFLLAGLGVAAFAAIFITRWAAANEDPDGEWTLTEIVEDDGSKRSPDSSVIVKYVVDVEHQTITNKWFHQDEVSPFETSTYSYEVTESENWRIPEAGPDGRGIEFAVECSPSTLTLTRTWHEGPDEIVAPAPAHLSGGAPPPAPVTKPPPRKFIMSR